MKTEPKPYGFNPNTTSWSKVRNAKYVPHQRCLHWIAHLRCPKGRALCKEDSGSHRWMDHTSAWLKESGQRILLCQPYYISCHELEDMIESFKRFDLKATIADNGWYGHNTVAIEIIPGRDTRS